MANLNIAIQIAAKDNASGPIGRIKSALGGLGQSASRGFAGLQNVAKIAGGALVAGGVAAGVAVAGIGVAAFNVANDVQTATSDIQAQLGTTTEEAERLGDVALDVFGNNFAGSIGEAGQAVALVRQQLGDLADDELQRVTENAFRLSDTFGVETPESINAAKTLMEDFGLTSDQAFDFIASGFQRGLDRSGDFLDTIGEYSTQFANGGADAGQFFSLMESGLQGGMLGTDKAADAFKEFRVRIQDGSKTTSEALAALGIDADEMAAGMADGTVTAADAFQLVVDKLNEVDDENVRMQAGVGLLGTQFEDLGTDAALALSTIGTNMGDLEGAASSLDTKYNNLGSVFEGFKRRALVAIEPIGSVLLDIANSAMPLVNTAFAFFETNIAPAIETAAGVVQSFLANLQEGMSPIDAFIEAIWGLAPPEVLAFLVNLRDEVLPGLSAWFTDSVQPVIDMITQFVSWQDVLVALGIVVAATVLPALYGIVAAAAPVIAVGAALVGAIALARNAWENDWGGIRTAVQGAWDALQPRIAEGKRILNEFSSQVLPPLRQAWTTLGQVWQTSIKPALGELWTAVGNLTRELGIGTGKTDGWEVAMGILRGTLDAVMIGVNLLSPAIRIAGDLISGGIGYVTDFVDGLRSMKQGVDALLEPLRNMSNKIGDLIDKAKSLPDWLIPGSPTPFETGLRGIGSAVRSMPNLGQALNVSGPSTGSGLAGGGGLALTGGSAGGGGITIGSITINAGTYEGGREAGRGFVDELTRRGLGSF
jgi:phage-related minor tail protein